VIALISTVSGASIQLGFDFSGTIAEADSAVKAIGVLFHACGVVNSSNEQIIYVDGVNEGTASGDTISQTPDRMRIGTRSRSTAVAHWDGMLAEFGIWNTALSPFEVKLLGPQYRWSPLKVRRQSLVWYESFRFPDYHYDLEHRQGKIMLTNFGSTFDSDHPYGIVYPQEDRMIFPSEQAAAPGGLSIPVAYHHYQRNTG